MVTVSSGRITTQAVSSGAAACAAARAGKENSSASPPPTAAETLRNSRRDSLERVVMAVSSRFHLGGRVDRGAHPLIGAAAADIGDLPVDVGIARVRVLRE